MTTNNFATCPYSNGKCVNTMNNHLKTVVPPREGEAWGHLPPQLWPLPTTSPLSLLLFKGTKDRKTLQEQFPCTFCPPRPNVRLPTFSPPPSHSRWHHCYQSDENNIKAGKMQKGEKSDTDASLLAFMAEKYNIHMGLGENEMIGNLRIYSFPHSMVMCITGWQECKTVHFHSKDTYQVK